MQLFKELVFFLIYFLIRGKLLYNVVLVSAIQQCKLAILNTEHYKLKIKLSAPSTHPQLQAQHTMR